MKIYPFKATVPRLDKIGDINPFFKSVKESYPSLIKLDFFKDDTDFAFYVYQISQGKHSLTGLLCSTDLQEFENNKIKKHEQTLLKKELLMLRLLEEREAMIKPVLVAYKAKKSIEAILAKITKKKAPQYDISFDDGENHKIWKVKNPKKLEKIKTLFAEKVKKSYIADGHHRSTTTKMIYEGDTITTNCSYQGILTAFFSFSQLKIYDYNRVISLPPNLDLNSFTAQLSKHGTWSSEKPKANKKYQLQLFFNSEWKTFYWNPKLIARYKKEKGILLNVHLFNAIIINEILGIQNIRETDYVVYIEGTKGRSGIKKLVSDSDRKIGIKLSPVKQEDLIGIADAGQYMPPKSTYFEPRIKNGVIVQKF